VAGLLVSWALDGYCGALLNCMQSLQWLDLLTPDVGQRIGHADRGTDLDLTLDQAAELELSEADRENAIAYTWDLQESVEPTWAAGECEDDLGRPPTRERLHWRRNLLMLPTRAANRAPAMRNTRPKASRPITRLSSRGRRAD
jgi:hypothetical protein